MRPKNKSDGRKSSPDNNMRLLLQDGKIKVREMKYKVAKKVIKTRKKIIRKVLEINFNGGNIFNVINIQAMAVLK